MVWCCPPPPPLPTWQPPPTPHYASLGLAVVRALRRGAPCAAARPPPPVVWFWVNPPFPRLWVVGFRFSVLAPLPVVWWWVLGLRCSVCTSTPPVVWWWGCLGFRCLDMKGFRVEGQQQLGAAQTETMAHPGECRHFGHATKLHSFKSHNTHEDRGFGGGHPCDCWHF